MVKLYIFFLFTDNNDFLIGERMIGQCLYISYLVYVLLYFV